MNAHRRLGAALFDEAVRQTGLPIHDLVERIKQELDRPTLSRQSVHEWRRGHQQVPIEVYLAVCKIAGAWPVSLMGTVLSREPTLLQALPPEIGQTDELVRSLLALRALVATRDVEQG